MLLSPVMMVVRVLSLIFQGPSNPALVYPNADRMQSPARQSPPFARFPGHSRQVILVHS